MQLFFAHACARFAGPDQIGELDAVEFGPDIAQPMPDIAAQHERIVRGLVARTLVGDKFEERNRGDFDLLIGHLIELGNRELGGVLDAMEIGVVGRLVPFEKAGVVDEVLHQEIFGALHEVRGLRDLVQRGDRRPQYMKHGKGDLA